MALALAPARGGSNLIGIHAGRYNVHMSTTFEATIDEKGIIRLPEQVMAQLGLRPGAILIVEQGEKDTISLRTDADEPRLINKSGILVTDAELLVDSDRFIHQQRSERARHLLGE